MKTCPEYGWHHPKSWYYRLHEKKKWKASWTPVSPTLCFLEDPPRCGQAAPYFHGHRQEWLLPSRLAHLVGRLVKLGTSLSLAPQMLLGGCLVRAMRKGIAIVQKVKNATEAETTVFRNSSRSKLAVWEHCACFSRGWLMWVSKDWERSVGNPEIWGDLSYFYGESLAIFPIMNINNITSQQRRDCK